MPTTASGIWYPDSNNHTRIWDILQETAESVQAALDVQDGRLDDVEAEQAYSTLSVTYGGNVIAAPSSAGAVLRKWGRVATLSAELGFTGSVSANAALLTIPAAGRPTGRRIPGIAFTSAGMQYVLVGTDGTVRLPNSGFSAASGVNFGISWVI